MVFLHRNRTLYFFPSSLAEYTVCVFWNYNINFVDEWCGRAQCIVDGAISRLVVLSALRNQAQQAKKSKPVGNTPSWPLHQLFPLGFCFVWVPALTSLSGELWCGTVKWGKPFPSWVTFGHCVLSQPEKPQLRHPVTRWNFNSRGDFITHLGKAKLLV